MSEKNIDGSFNLAIDADVIATAKACIADLPQSTKALFSEHIRKFNTAHRLFKKASRANNVDFDYCQQCSKELSVAINELFGFNDIGSPVELAVRNESVDDDNEQNDEIGDNNEKNDEIGDENENMRNGELEDNMKNDENNDETVKYDEEEQEEEVDQEYFDDDNIDAEQTTMVTLATPEQIASCKTPLDTSLVVVDERDEGLGRGVYAATNIPAETKVCSYPGVMVDVNSHTESLYRIYYNNNLIIDGDPALPGSIGHVGQFCNDAKGNIPIKTGNNARFSVGHINVGGQKIPTVWIVTTKAVKKGTQICVSYGEEYWNHFRNN